MLQRCPYTCNPVNTSRKLDPNNWHGGADIMYMLIYGGLCYVTRNSIRGRKFSWGSMPPDPLLCVHHHTLKFSSSMKNPGLILGSREG